MSLLISIAGSVIGTLIVGPVKWLSSKTRGRPTTEARDRSVAAGRDVSGQVATGDQSAVAGRAGVVVGAGSITHIQQGLSAEDHDRLVRIEGKLDQWGEHAAPPGASTPDTSALAVADVTERTERLLQEAVELQRQNKEREAIELLLTAYDMEMPPDAKAELHILAGIGFLNLSELEQAEAQLRLAILAVEDTEDKENVAAALGNLGIVFAQRGDLDKAEGHFKKALTIAEAIGDRQCQALQHGNMGIISAHRGDLGSAEESHNRALAISNEIGDKDGRATAFGNLGNVHLLRGELEQARECYETTRGIYGQVRDALGEARALGNLGLVYADIGDLDKAENHHRQALTIDERIGYRLGQATQLGNLGNLYSIRGDQNKAEEYHCKALLIDEEIGNKVGQAEDIENLGLLAEHNGDTGKARMLLTTALSLYVEAGVDGEKVEKLTRALNRLGDQFPEEK